MTKTGNIGARPKDGQYRIEKKPVVSTRRTTTGGVWHGYHEYLSKKPRKGAKKAKTGSRTVYREKSPAYATDTTAELTPDAHPGSGVPPYEPVGDLRPGLWEDYQSIRHLFKDQQSYDAFVN